MKIVKRSEFCGSKTMCEAIGNIQQNTVFSGQFCGFGDGYLWLRTNTGVVMLVDGWSYGRSRAGSHVELKISTIVRDYKQVNATMVTDV